jgi:hypothetical protein
LCLALQLPGRHRRELANIAGQSMRTDVFKPLALAFATSLVLAACGGGSAGPDDDDDNDDDDDDVTDQCGDVRNADQVYYGTLAPTYVELTPARCWRSDRSASAAAR